jgi:hypothetical protein
MLVIHRKTIPASSLNMVIEPTIFVDDTSILFAHSNLTDLNKNIHIVFTTLNEWLGADKLALNFNKTNYVHFTAKRNMLVNFKIGFNNNFFTSSSYTKFLGVTMNNTLSWNNNNNNNNNIEVHRSF